MSVLVAVVGSTVLVAVCSGSSFVVIPMTVVAAVVHQCNYTTLKPTGRRSTTTGVEMLLHHLRSGMSPLPPPPIGQRICPRISLCPSLLLYFFRLYHPQHLQEKGRRVSTKMGKLKLYGGLVLLYGTVTLVLVPVRCNNVVLVASLQQQSKENCSFLLA